MANDITNEIERVELAKAYVALSNSHRLDLIISMFADDARYQSSNVGSFAGTGAIRNMMGGFFDRYPDVFWDAHNFSHIDARTIEFKFLMTATDKQTYQRIERSGEEEIEFNEAGLITRLKVL